MKKKNKQEEKQSEKDKKHFSKLIGMPFRNPGSAWITKRHANKLTKMFLVFFTLLFLLLIFLFHFVLL